ncbi:MAG: aminotransferase class I/II-fold pyridoxal phosphate-dependent enzyme [Bacteroidota bacterium]
MIIPEANRLGSVKEYYFSKKLREIRARVAAGEQILNLGIGNPDMSPSNTTLKTLVREAIEPGKHGYQPYKGTAQLRYAFANWYENTYRVQLNAESEILPLMGSKEGIMHISMAFLNTGDQVLVPNPGYPAYSSAARIAGAEIVPYKLSPENDWYPNLEELAKQDLARVKIMWINYPHMPTGTRPSDELFGQLIAFAKEHKILLCHDNPYSLVLNPDPKSILSFPGAKEVAIELNSLSKSHNMAGWRIGLFAGAEAYLQAVLKVKSNMDSGMFLPLQEAAVSALANSFAWHGERNTEYQKRRNVAFKMLDELECTYKKDQAGMFVWARIPDSESSGEEFSERILNSIHVFLTPGFIFGDQGEKYIRISLCTPMDGLQLALERIREFTKAAV